MIVIFGTKRLSSIGSDLGGAVKGFRKSMADADKDEDAEQLKKPDAEFSDSGTGATDNVSESDSTRSS